MPPRTVFWIRGASLCPRQQGWQTHELRNENHFTVLLICFRKRGQLRTCTVVYSLRKFDRLSIMCTCGDIGIHSPRSLEPLQRLLVAAMQQISDWLNNLGMSEYAERFAENRIDLSVLPDLSRSGTD